MMQFRQILTRTAGSAHQMHRNQRENGSQNFLITSRETKVSISIWNIAVQQVKAGIFDLCMKYLKSFCYYVPHIMWWNSSGFLSPRVASKKPAQ